MAPSFYEDIETEGACQGFVFTESNRGIFALHTA
jgi:hypothetical protein